MLIFHMIITKKLKYVINNTCKKSTIGRNLLTQLYYCTSLKIADLTKRDNSEPVSDMKLKVYFFAWTGR